MVKYKGPRVRIIRRLGMLPGLTNKIFKCHKNKTPGERGQEIKYNLNNSTLKEDYKNCLFEKQKLRYNYGITEKQLYNYYTLSKKNSKLTGIFLLELLESRLDSVIYRFGFTQTMAAARQLINHNHILVNNKVVSVPSFFLQKNDIISVSQKSKNLIRKFIKAQQLRQEIMCRKIARYENINDPLTNYLLTPSHLKIDENLLAGKFLNAPNRKDFPLMIDEVKIIRYYSR